MQTHIYKYFLIIIFIIAAIVRLIGLSFNPPSLNWDEVSHGYNAYSILKTGSDEWGKSWPLIFQAYGDYKLPVYIYTTVPFVWALGLNAWSVRLPSVLAGTASVIFFYYLLKKATKDEKISLFAALFMALESWTVLVSRVALEANLANFFVLLAVYFFFKAKNGVFKHLLVSALFFGLSVWTYNTARIFVPLFILVIIALYKKNLRKRFSLSELVIAVLVLLLFFIPMAYQLILPQGQARYDLVSILNDNALYEIGLQRQNSDFGPIITRLLYNRVTYFIPKFIINYFSHFDPRFLFLSGSNHYQFSLPGIGLLSFVHIVVFYWGLFVSLRERKKWQILFLSWLLIAPLAASVTRESPHALRSLIMAPAVIVFIAIGLNYVLDTIKTAKHKQAFLVIYLLFIILSFLRYMNFYTHEYRNNYSWSWQYGTKQMSDYIKVRYEDYDKFLITKKHGEPHEFILFYWPWEPKAYRNDKNLNRFYKSNWYWVDSFDKFYFLNDWEIVEGPQYSFQLESGNMVDCGEAKCLLITSAGNAPSDWDKIDEISFLDGSIAYEIYEE